VGSCAGVVTRLFNVHGVGDGISGTRVHILTIYLVCFSRKHIYDIAHLYVLLHGFSLVGPAFTTFGHMIKALLSYTVLLLAFNLYGTWALFINHTNETQACRDSYVFMLSRASNMIFYVFIVAAIVVFILAQCSTYNGCKCLRFSDLDETASDPEDDDDEKKDGAGSSSTAGAPASSQTLRSRRI